MDAMLRQSAFDPETAGSNNRRKTTRIDNNKKLNELCCCVIEYKRKERLIYKPNKDIITTTHAA